MKLLQLDANHWITDVSKIVCILITALVVSLFSLPATASSQDFAQLLEAVDKIEQNLKILVEQEAQARKDGMVEMDKKLSGITQVPAEKSSLLYSLEKDVDRLTKQVADLSAISKQSAHQQAGNFDLESIINDIAFLKAENTYLRDLMKANKQQLASLDGGPIPSDDQKMDQLINQMIAIDAQLQQMASQKQHSSPDKTQAPNFSLGGKMFSHVKADFADEGYSEFAVSRTYVTVRSKLKDFGAVRITTDLRTVEDKYDIIVKYAYLDVSPTSWQGHVSTRLGLQPTMYIDYMNKLWGRRYIEKTIGDKKKLLTSSDLGLSVTAKFGPKGHYGFAQVAMFNGTSYSGVSEKNGRKDFNIVAVVKPLSDVKAFKKSTIMTQFYSGTQNKSLDDIVEVDGVSGDTTITAVSASDWKRQNVSVGALLDFKHTVDFGFDLDYTTIGKGAGNEAVKKSMMSFWSSFYLCGVAPAMPLVKEMNLFARIDLYNPDKTINNDGQTGTMFGVEVKPVKGFYTSLNFRMTDYEDHTIDSENSIYLNTQFKF